MFWSPDLIFASSCLHDPLDGQNLLQLSFQSAECISEERTQNGHSLCFLFKQNFWNNFVKSKLSCTLFKNLFNPVWILTSLTQTWSPIFFLPPLSFGVEDEGTEFGWVEEHPWASSLGGLQGVPGAAAQQAEQNRLMFRITRHSGPNAHHSRVNSVVKVPLQPRLNFQKIWLCWT